MKKILRFGLNSSLA